jgi:hypothetical protein
MAPISAIKNYSRDHVWRFENGVETPASAAPAYLGNPQRVDPESAFVAALSSCHILSEPRNHPLGIFADFLRKDLMTTLFEERDNSGQFDSQSNTDGIYGPRRCACN